ncbi:MAG: hypothetical protein EOL95_09355 [Bacteroidia bacterium]|nr:hypothetical protein [Bacteroidia bacterium]
MEERCKICGKRPTINTPLELQPNGDILCREHSLERYQKENRVYKYLIKRMMLYLGKTRKECKILFAKNNYSYVSTLEQQNKRK